MKQGMIQYHLQLLVQSKVWHTSELTCAVAGMLIKWAHESGGDAEEGSLDKILTCSSMCTSSVHAHQLH